MSASKPSALGLLLLLALLPCGASAGNQNGPGQDGRQDRNRRGGERSVPEFDPAVAGAIAAVVAGGALVLARRRLR